MKQNATSEGTNAYKQEFRKRGLPETAFHLLGRTHLTTSILGFGSYRIHEDSSQHINALDRALSSGCNLIDTSTNYTDGGSERCIGKVLKASFSRGHIHRENIIVVSKVGYVQGENLEIASEQEELGTPFPEMVKYADGCWHCIHPRFIREQLEESLKRTGLSKIDVYLLHNPEYFFLDALHHPTKKSLSELRQVFYHRIREAFQCLEDCVAEGLISHYGVSSNAFGRNTKFPDMTSVSEMWNIAEEISMTRSGEAGQHHFSVIQLPLNLFESDPAFEQNAKELTTLAFAEQKGLGVLVNRPLNAFLSNELFRLADFPRYEATFSLQELIKMLLLLEEEFVKTYADKITVDPESLQPDAYFRWGEEIRNINISQLNIDQWSHVSQEMLLPQVHYFIQELDKVFSASENNKWKEWRNGYLGTIEQLVRAVHNECIQKAQAFSTEIAARINPHLPEAWRGESLSRKALGVAAYTPGVSCVLTGMRKPEYVADAMGMVSLPPLKDVSEVYKAMQ